MVTLPGLDPSTYEPHALHASTRLFRETNCYTDLWIELLHASGRDPVAMLSYCATVDFEGDQWTFFKPPPEDLERLYGLEVQEFVIYRPVTEHIIVQSELGRTVIVEVDGYYLPDTAGRSYRTSHEKTSIAVDSIDVEAERATYFHGPGLFALGGEDFRNTFRLGRPFSPDVLAPYIELVRADRLPATPPHRLRSVASDILERRLERRPIGNPIERFGVRLSQDLERLEGDVAAYHEYAFVTARQCGAAWEAAASFVEWLDDDLREPAKGFARLAAASKTLVMRIARAAATGRPLDASAALSEMAATWDETIEALG